MQESRLRCGRRLLLLVVLLYSMLLCMHALPATPIGKVLLTLPTQRQEGQLHAVYRQGR